jgi:pectin methylesterase-like acyl-CoA thioesterase
MLRFATLREPSTPVHRILMAVKSTRQKTLARTILVIFSCLLRLSAFAGTFEFSDSISEKNVGVQAPLFPANGAKEVCPDTPLRITFERTPLVGAGEIKVFEASGNSLVESIDVAVPVRTRSIGGQPNYNYYPVLISGNVASIYLSHSLGYGRAYYVEIDPQAFKDAAGSALVNFAQWHFSTKVGPPQTGLSRITVAADGRGEFATVQGALDFVPERNSAPTTVFIRNGTYNEIVFFTEKHNLTILGEDRRQTIISYPNNERFNGNAGGNPFGPGSAAPGTQPARRGAVYRRGLLLAHRVNNLTIANLTLHNTTPVGGSQAEAIILNGTANAHAIITNVDLYSFQDTLQINGQAYLSNCYIEGDVDFMWGTGPVFFDNCHARSLRSNAFYTQIRNPATNHGFVYRNCLFDGAPGVSGNFLSRIAPARFPYSEVVLLNCVLTEAVGAAAWRLDQSNDASNVHFWEYQSRGPNGAPIDSSGRLAIAKQLKLPEDREAIADYQDPRFVLGAQWTPALAPIITSQPKSFSVRRGQMIALSVTVSAVPSPNFQWKKDGRNIPGANQAGYTINQAKAADAGSYRVIISNPAGQAASSAAGIKVKKDS